MSTTPETFLGQILVDGQWVDYARGTEKESRLWQARDPKNRRVVDWIRKTQVIIAPKPEPRHFTYDEMPQAVNALESADDLSGYWYAWGRLDQGHAPVAAQTPTEDHPSTTATSWLFGAMWMQVQRELRDPEHPRAHGTSMQGAWDNFVETGGRSLDNARHRQ